MLRNTSAVLVSVFLTLVLLPGCRIGPFGGSSRSGDDGVAALWTNANGDGLWSNPLNWDTDTVPDEATNVIFDGSVSSADCSLTSAAAVRSVTFRGGYEGNLALTERLTVANDLIETDCPDHSLTLAGGIFFEIGGTCSLAHPEGWTLTGFPFFFGDLFLTETGASLLLSGTSEVHGSILAEPGASISFSSILNFKGSAAQRIEPSITGSLPIHVYKASGTLTFAAQVTAATMVPHPRTQQAPVTLEFLDGLLVQGLFLTFDTSDYPTIMAFTPGTTCSITGGVDIRCDSTDQLQLVSTVPGSQWTFEYTSTSAMFEIRYTLIRDSILARSPSASFPTLYNCTDGGNNTLWSF